MMKIEGPTEAKSFKGKVKNISVNDNKFLTDCSEKLSGVCYVDDFSCDHPVA